MKVLVVGSGGREHAIVTSVAKSRRVDKIYCAPGNAGIGQLAECVNIGAMEFEKLVAFAKEKEIDFTIVGMDDPLVGGIVDVFEAEGLKVFGPRKNAAILEGSKAFSKDLMKKYNIPTAGYETFDDPKKALEYLETVKMPIVLKADGLALGKGVLICNTLEEAKAGVKEIMEDKKVGSAGNHMVIEEFMTGREVSVLSFVDGKTIKIMSSAQDHKRAKASILSSTPSAASSTTSATTQTCAYFRRCAAASATGWTSSAPTRAVRRSRTYYQELLSTAHLELFYCGSAGRERVEEAISRAFAPLQRGRVVPPVIAEKKNAPETPREITERMDVTQGRLSMGWRASTNDAPAMMLANLIFGGYSNSKLFLNVREKLSLCYYASSTYHRSKGIVTVSSGIECRDVETAKREILAQLASVQRGEFEEWEVEGARACLIASLESRGDSAGRMEENALGQAATGIRETADELIAALRAVTNERIAEAAQSMTLDTVYFLTGEDSKDE